MLRQKNVILHDLKLKESRIVFKLKKTRNILFGSSVDREDTILFGDYGVMIEAKFINHQIMENHGTLFLNLVTRKSNKF